MTYAELAEECLRVAAGLRDLGCERNDRVAIYLDKRIETVATIFGTSAAGAAFVPVNPLFKPHQVSHVLADSGARFLVTSRERLELLLPGLEPGSLEHVVCVGEGGGTDADVAVIPYRDLPLDSDAGNDNGVDNDLAAIFYTSGSTGSPKGVVLSHRNLIAGAESVTSYLDNTAEDVILAALPLSFDAGFSQLTTAFAVGAHVVLMNYLLAGDVVRLCARHGVTGLTAVPPLWIRLAEQDWPPEAGNTMRYFANTGGRMPKVTLDRLREVFPQAKPFLMYGLTEAFRSTYLDPAEVDRRPESIGKAIPNAEILVVGPDGRLQGPGEEGELVHRGPTVSLGYWNDPERTRERFRPVPNGPPGLPSEELAVWSGDIVQYDDEGFLYFVGRDDEMIKTSGYRVSPTEIEEAAYGTGLVREAVAFGVEDDRIGQSITLVASPPVDQNVSADQIVGEMRGRLPLYMIPREVILAEDLPRSPNGKIDRALVRQRLDDD